MRQLPFPSSFGTKRRPSTNFLPRLSTLFAFALFCAPGVAGAGKLDLGPENILVNVKARGVAEMLLDEQTLSGDPKNGSGGSPATRWAVSYDRGSISWFLPLVAIIDLGSECDLTDIYLRDTTGTGDCTISAGSPETGWTELFTDGNSNYMSWNGHTVDVSTRYLRVSIADMAGMPNEIVVYGARTSPVIDVPEPQYHAPIAMDELMGVNVLHVSPLGLMEAFGTLREYHNWAWTENSAQGENKFSPAYVGSWDFDKWYHNASKTGFLLSPSIKGTVDWLLGSVSSNREWKPLDFEASPALDAEDPFSYIEHADHMFQVAARYGSTPVDPQLLKLSPEQDPLTGLGYLSYIENWNEQNMWWNGRNGYFSPYEYAAMSSADYDGHLGAMGNTVGVVHADPNMRFVMSGTAGLDLDYVKSMKHWCDLNRGGDFPWDVINLHHYSNDYGGQGGSSVGISPEADEFREKLEKIVDYRNRYLPGVEVWITEFGYDTAATSPQGVPVIGSHSTEEVQAWWNVRSFLAIAAAGVDRAHLFNLTDPATGTPGRYGTSGVVEDSANGYRRKVAWYHLYTMRRLLTGLTYAGEVPSGDPEVMIYKFSDENDEVRAYAVWCPTSDDTAVSSFSLPLEGSPSSAKAVELVDGSTTGNSTSLAISGGAVTVDVSEKPLFVMVDDPALGRGPDTIVNVVPSMIVNESGFGNPAAMFDEQSTAINAQFGSSTVAPTSRWMPTGANPPVSAYVDFGSEIPITKIMLFDANNSGGVTFEIGEPGNWEEVAFNPLKSYMSWSTHVIMRHSRYLRITMESGGSIFHEVAVFTNDSLREPFVPPVVEEWTSENIGAVVPGTSTPMLPGSATPTATGFIVEGDGRMPGWATTDGFHFVHTPVTGDAVVTTKVDSITWEDAKSNGFIMFRESTADNARYVRMGLFRNWGAAIGYRMTVPGHPMLTRQWGLFPPSWIRLVREGDQFTGYYSSDGISWTQLGTPVTIDLPDTALVGLGVYSNSVNNLTTVEFSNLTID